MDELKRINVDFGDLKRNWCTHISKYWNLNKMLNGHEEVMVLRNTNPDNKLQRPLINGKANVYTQRVYWHKQIKGRYMGTYSNVSSPDAPPQVSISLLTVCLHANSC